jgi:SPW repeat-containing protein
MRTRLRREAVLDLYNCLLALLLFASPWLLKLTNSTAKVEMWAAGAAIAAISFAAVAAYANWEEWANVLLGIWLVVSPWVLGFAHTRAMHFSIGIGLVVAFFALLELWLQYDATLLTLRRRTKFRIREPHNSNEAEQRVSGVYSAS